VAGQAAGPGRYLHSDRGRLGSTPPPSTPPSPATTTSPCRSAAPVNADDDALAESVIGLYKTELIKKEGPWTTLAEVERATAEYVNWFNTGRLSPPSAAFRPMSTKPPTTLKPSPEPRLDLATEACTKTGAVQERRNGCGWLRLTARLAAASRPGRINPWPKSARSYVVGAQLFPPHAGSQMTVQRFSVITSTRRLATGSGPPSRRS
jgi:Integrase core domain